MHCEAEVVYELSAQDELALCPVPWQNMVESLLQYSSGVNGLPTSVLQNELSRFDAQYDGSPYVFFRDKRKFMLWELTYSTVNKSFDNHS